MIDAILDYVIGFLLVVAGFAAIIKFCAIMAEREDRRRQEYWRKRAWEENPRLQAEVERGEIEAKLQRALEKRPAGTGGEHRYWRKLVPNGMKYSQWISVLFALAFLYGWFQYERFLDFERGYIYDAATGALYKAKLKPAFSDLRKWGYLNPFETPSYFISSVDDVEYLGYLADLVAKRREWEEDFWRKIDGQSEHWESDKWLKDLEESPALHATEYIRYDMDPSTLLPVDGTY